MKFLEGAPGLFIGSGVAVFFPRGATRQCCQLALRKKKEKQQEFKSDGH